MFWPVGGGAKLVEILERKRTDEQTVFSGKGLVAVITARNPQGTRVLVEQLTRLGYRRESKPRTPVPLSPTPTQHQTPTAPEAAQRVTTTPDK